MCAETSGVLFNPILSTLGILASLLYAKRLSAETMVTACSFQNKLFAAELTSIQPVGDGSPPGMATVSISKSN